MRKEKGGKENIEKWKTPDFGRGKVEALFHFSTYLRSTPEDGSEGNQCCRKIKGGKDKAKVERYKIEPRES